MKDHYTSPHLNHSLGHIEAQLQGTTVRLMDLKEAVQRIDDRLTVVEHKTLQWTGALSWGVTLSTLLGSICTYMLKIYL